MSFAIVRVEVRGSSCVRVELGNFSKFLECQFLDNFEEMFFGQTNHLVGPDIVEKLIKTRWPDSSQPEIAKPDWYQRVTVDYWHWTLTGPTRWLVWAKNTSSKLSRNWHSRNFRVKLERIGFSSTRTVRTRHSTLLVHNGAFGRQINNRILPLRAWFHCDEIITDNNLASYTRPAVIWDRQHYLCSGNTHWGEIWRCFPGTKSPPMSGLREAKTLG